MSELEQAIKDMEEARESHVQWAAHLGGAPDCEWCDPSITGTKEENEEWVKKYDRVLDLLRRSLKSAG
jgi:HEPN domain-containing protein